MSLFHYVYTHSVAILFFFLAIVSALFHAFAPLPLLWMLAYGVALVYFPRMWIVAVPALLPLLDWSLWTGNLLYNEYDVLLLATLAVLFWRHDDSVKLVAPPYQLLYYLLLFAFIASFLKNAWPLFQEGAQPDDIYQNNWNSLRIGKGFFYAWLLWPFLRRELLIAPERCQRLLAIGLVASLFMFGLLVCWERGILNTLFTLHDRYALLSRILDFASTYRITGWFTEMHVGGEAVDGYLISLTPLVVYLLTRPTSPKVFYIILMAVGMGFYSIIVTFTRTTIASFIFAMLAFVIVLLVHKRQSSTTFQPSFIGLIFLFILNTVGLLIGFKMAGYQALFTGVFAIFGALLWAYFFRKHPWYLSFLVLTGIGWLAAWGICDSALESKWHDFTYPDAIQLAILLGLAYLGSGWLFGKQARQQQISLKSLQIALIFLSLVVFLGIGLSSTRFEDRFSQVDNDFSTRKQHWQTMLSFRNSDSFTSNLIGEGIGTIPSLFYQNTFLNRSLPKFRLSTENGQNYLILGAGDFHFFQKLVLNSEQIYHLSITARLTSSAVSEALIVDICKKHILYSEHYQPSCISNALRVKNINTWETFHWDIDHKSAHLLEWPSMLILHKDGKEPVDIQSVSLVDTSGHEYIRNPEFSTGLQSWLWIIDHDHLPWHSKQLFIHVWLEQGWLGLGLFISLLIMAFKHQYKLLKRGASIPVAFLPAMTGIILEGLTGTMLDAPRVCTQIYLILFAALQWPDDNTLKRQANRLQRKVEQSPYSQ